MVTGDQPRHRIPREEALPLTVGEVMIARPKTVTPATPLADAVELLDRSREPRLVVLDADGDTLRGLLCFNQGSASFCVR